MTQFLFANLQFCNFLKYTFFVRHFINFFYTGRNDMFKNGLNYKEREIDVVFRMEIQNKVVHNDTHTQGLESCLNS